MDKEDKKVTLQMINDWVRFCDSKAGILLALQGIILTIIFTVTSRPDSGWNPAFILFIIGNMIFSVSIIIGINTILPILEVGQPNSKIFFGHISSYENPKKYIQEVNQPSYNFEEDVLTQIWANSRVAWRKYELIRSALLWGVIGFSIIGASYILK